MTGKNGEGFFGCPIRFATQRSTGEPAPSWPPRASCPGGPPSRSPAATYGARFRPIRPVSPGCWSIWRLRFPRWKKRSVSQWRGNIWSTKRRSTPRWSGCSPTGSTTTRRWSIGTKRWPGSKRSNGATNGGWSSWFPISATGNFWRSFSPCTVCRGPSWPKPSTKAPSSTSGSSPPTAAVSATG